MDATRQIKAWRIDEREYSLGDRLPLSRVWVDGDPTADILPGTSALALGTPMSVESDRVTVYPDDPTRRCTYWGRRYLVAGEVIGIGEDDGEVLVRSATVVG